MIRTLAISLRRISEWRPTCHWIKMYLLCLINYVIQINYIIQILRVGNSTIVWFELCACHCLTQCWFAWIIYLDSHIYFIIGLDLNDLILTRWNGKIIAQRLLYVIATMTASVNQFIMYQTNTTYHIIIYKYNYHVNNSGNFLQNSSLILT
jgi:hypothetical protein